MRLSGVLSFLPFIGIATFVALAHLFVFSEKLPFALLLLAGKVIMAHPLDYQQVILAAAVAPQAELPSHLAS